MVLFFALKLIDFARKSNNSCGILKRFTCKNKYAQKCCQQEEKTTEKQEEQIQQEEAQIEEQETLIPTKQPLEQEHQQIQETIEQEQQNQQRNSTQDKDEEDEVLLEPVEKDDFDVEVFCKNMSNLEKEENMNEGDKDKLAQFFNNLQEAIEVDGDVDPLVAKTISNWQENITQERENPEQQQQQEDEQQE